MISEYEYWKIQQNLEGSIQQRLKQDAELKKQNKYGSSCLDDILEQEEFHDFVYGELGIVGGAFVLADKSRNELFYLQNKDLQRKQLQVISNFPFIEIPYKYNHIIKPNKQSKYNVDDKNKELLDALFIGTQDRRNIHTYGEEPPEIYKFLPDLLSKKEKKHLLPFERDLTDDGFKIIYCTVGEVTFHLYIWRLLFQLAQTRGPKEGAIQKGGYEQKFEFYYDFWQNLDWSYDSPEVGWIKTLRNKYEGKSYVHIQDKWAKLNEKVDIKQMLFPTYSFYQEYFFLGLIDQEEKATQSLLALTRYAIHIARNVLGWTAYDDTLDSVSALALPNQKENEILSPDTILTSLYILERRLNRVFNKKNTHKKSINLEQLKNSYQFDRCLQKIAKTYLFDILLKSTSAEVKIKDALDGLHKKTRFPILPYYYEVASGEVHQPKEHVVYSIWSSFDNKIPLNVFSDNKKMPYAHQEESAVAFLVITQLPIWKLDKQFTFTKNNESIHWISELSKETYKLIFRTLSFFSVLSRPLIDQMFYGEMIKKEIKKVSTSTDIGAFSHEMSKVVDNIFELSNVSFSEMFGEDTETVLAAITSLASRETWDKKNKEQYKKKNNQSLFKTYDANIHTVRKWRIIPDFDRFTIWNKYLNMWTGRRAKFVLDVEDEDNLNAIIEKSKNLSARMHTAVKMQNVDKSDNIARLVAYKENFDKEVNILLSKNLAVEYEEEYIKQLKLIDPIRLRVNNKTIDLTPQNALLRILIASITNIYEHTLSNFYLNVRIKESPRGDKALRFCFVNPCLKREEEPPESFGTKPVINSCLLLVDGTLEIFGSPSNLNQKQYWADKAKIDLEKEDIWLTNFIIPIKNIFAN